MSKPGRNDACHCGSGKKYKKCCLEADQAQERISREEEQLRQRDARQQKLDQWDSWQNRPSSCYQKGSDDDPFRDEEDDSYDEDNPADDFIQEFYGLKFIDKLSQFSLLLDSSSSLLPAVAFVCIESLLNDATTSDQRRDGTRCIERLRDEYPEIYAESCAYYASWYIANCLGDGITEEVSSFFRDSAAQSEKSIDVFFEAMVCLAYHNQADALVEGMNLAWPKLRKSPKIMEWARDEFVLMLSDLETFAWMARKNEADFDSLVRLMTSFFPMLDLPQFREYLGRISGEIVTEWTLKELSLGKKTRGTVGLLTQEFLGYLLHTEGVPLSKGRLAAYPLCDYLMERYDGELKLLKGTVPSKPLHQLCPDSATLDTFLSRKISMFSKQVNSVGTILELLPAWLRFLESRKLLDADLKCRIITDLLPIQHTWCDVLRKVSPDQILQSRISEAWEG
jgi:hypothetical protein